MKASVDQVYQALATRAGLAGWWTVDTQGESKVGGIVKFRFNDGTRDLGGFDMKVLDQQPGRRVQWQVVDGPEDWVGTRISFELKQDNDYAVVLFKHQGWKEPTEFMHHCSTKWAIFLMSLKSLAETGKGTPSPHEARISNWH
jgi:uncharacterized protein YndB with AHSA1/START domain